MLPTRDRETTTLTMTANRSSSPDYPETRSVGEHLVIDVTEWVPGPDPDPHRRREEQSEYLERYYRCILCGVERLRTDEFPEECAGSGPEREANQDARPGERDSPRS